MSAEWVRTTYNVPARRGMRVHTCNGVGTIVGFRGGYLRVRIDGEARTGSYHPTWQIEYPGGAP